MLKVIFRSAAANIRRLLYIWLAVLVANQLFIFGACFAPYCLAAAVPHTLAIAMLVNFFGFKRQETEKVQPPYSSRRAPPVKAASVVNRTDRAANPAEWKRPIARKSWLGPIIVYGLIAIGVCAGVLFKSGSRAVESPTSDPTAKVESDVEIREDGDVLYDRSSPRALVSAEERYQEVPDDGATQVDGPTYGNADGEIPDEHLSLAQRRAAQPTGALASRALDDYEDDDDEFDVNDIEQYERLTGKKHPRGTDSTKQNSYVEDDGHGAKSSSDILPVAEQRAIIADGPAGHRGLAPLAYQCINSSGRVGAGTGRLTREGEYSPFFRTIVHADEFVIFQYHGSTKEYWFKSSKCQRL